MEQSAGYPYTPIAAGYIRLLRINHQESTDDRLSFDIEDHQLSELPDYSAVSYMWGTSEQTAVIHVNQQPFKIRPHLLDCIKTLTKPHLSPRQLVSWPFLWIDAICINQCDNEEKSRQVRLMGAIYSRAAVVSVWLQSDRWNQSLALGPRQSSTDTKHFEHLGYSPYWERAWIVQEFLLARHLHIYGIDCRLVHQDGGFTASSRGRHRRHDIGGHGNLEAGKSLLEFVGTGPESSRKPYLMTVTGKMTAISGFQGLVVARYDTGADIRSFSMMLLVYADNKCHDPRDKVFSILSLLGQEEAKALSRIFPDYDMTETSVAVMALTHIKAFDRSFADKLDLTAVENTIRHLALRAMDRVLETYQNEDMDGDAIKSKLPRTDEDQKRLAVTFGIAQLIEWLLDCATYELG